METKYKYTAQQISKALGNEHELTLEQAEAIENASTTSPELIVAGAGSGKTSLMAVRVPWLVANGIAKPEQILGLTFTRKAAAELAKRVHESLIALRDHGEFWPADLPADFTPPNISTYNSYANSLFRDFALQLGQDADAIQLTEATQYQFAKQLLNSRGARVANDLLDEDFSADDLIEKVVALAQTMNENLVTAEDIRGELEMVHDAIAAMPKKVGDVSGEQYGYISDLLMTLKRTELIARLAADFNEQKLIDGRIDYSDQVVLAYRAVCEITEVKEREQDRYRQVLLDEYQDTSFLQTKLLSGLFFDRAVLAVGDPNQSIYGWRGASASNLAEFSTDFSSKKVEQKKLSKSWRNPKDVLKLANHLAAPLSQPASYLNPEAVQLVSSLKVVTLTAPDNAKDGIIDVAFEQDLNQEAAKVASWFKAKLAQPSPNKDGSQTAALLVRKRANIRSYVEALRDLDLEVEVVGLGGLLEMPEIADIKSALAVLVRPDAGTELIRLLTGARWQIAAKDIAELHKYANFIASSSREAATAVGRSDESAISLVDALDRLTSGSLSETIHFSEEGLKRLRDAADVFSKMRQRIGLPLPELVRAIVGELWIDIELMANPSRKHPMIHVNEFISVVTNFVSSSNVQSISMFLDYLEYASDRDRLEAPRSKPQNKVIQVLTIHGAKGLEWDYVALPSLMENEFPSRPRSMQGWLSEGQLPYGLRGDKRTLPMFDYETPTTQKLLNDSRELFSKTHVREMLMDEERRLIYVAITRPKHELLLSGCYWKPGTKEPMEPSRFLLECLELQDGPLAEFGLLPARVSDDQPLQKADLTEKWPKKPFGEERESKVQASAAMVTEAIANPRDIEENQDKSVVGEMPAAVKGKKKNHDQTKLIKRLLREHEISREQIDVVDFPVRVPASNFKAYLGELEEVAGGYLRPVPSQPYKQSRRGNLFHAWVEKKFAPTGILFDDEEFEIEDEEDFYAIEELQKNFEASRFSALKPLAIEMEVQLTIDQNTFICKMDAVYETEDGVQIVDWKTNTPPTDAKDEYRRSLQLGLYRLAYAEFTGLPIEKVQASFFFVGESVELAPKGILGKAEILDEWRKVLEKLVD
jgi:DNA helicase-2/ATP-dependent DNA helicase PcrA